MVYVDGLTQFLPSNFSGKLSLDSEWEMAFRVIINLSLGVYAHLKDHWLKTICNDESACLFCAVSQRLISDTYADASSLLPDWGFYFAGR